MNQSSETPRTRRNNVIYTLEILRAKSFVLKALLDYRVVQIKALYDASKYDPNTHRWIKGRINIISTKLTEISDEIERLQKEMKNHGNSNNQ